MSQPAPLPSFDRLVERRIGLGISIPRSWTHQVTRDRTRYQLTAGRPGRLPRLELVAEVLAELGLAERPTEYPQVALERRLSEVSGELREELYPFSELLRRAVIAYQREGKPILEHLYLRGYDRLGWRLSIQLAGPDPLPEQVALAETIAWGANLDIRRPVHPPTVPEDAALFFDGYTFVREDGQGRPLRHFISPQLGLALSAPLEFVWSDDSQRERFGVVISDPERDTGLRLHVYSPPSYGQQLFSRMLIQHLAVAPAHHVNPGPVIPTAFGGVSYFQVLNLADEPPRFSEHYIYGTSDHLYHLEANFPWPVEIRLRSEVDRIIESVRFFAPPLDAG